MNTPIQLYAGGTLTATANETGVNAGTLSNGGTWDPDGTPFELSVPITTLKHSSGNETYTFAVQDSPDGTTWTARSVVRDARDDSGPGNTDGGSGTIKFHVEIKNPANVRLVVTIGGTSPTITLGAVTMAPVFAFFIQAQVINEGGGWISLQPLVGSTELSESIFAGPGGNVQGVRNIDITNLVSAASALFGQGTKAMIGFAPTS
jgi:hypothetical protein